MQGEIDRLHREIAALGAVNLAALDELTTARERKQFLDAQSADLNEAMATLEDAIRKIDGETRELLAGTFNIVNEHFGKMFPELFGGGNARLVMTGDEILDSGVQVMAQPPGKKNQTIHLLSGGEKALTAIALVFAIFQLNPAPFCLLDEVDAPLDDANTERYAKLVTSMSRETQFLFISHNKIAMEMAEQLIGVTMQEQGVSRIVAVDMESAVSMAEAAMSDVSPSAWHPGRPVLAVLVAYNTWTTRRNTPRQPEARRGRTRRPSAERQEPVFDPSLDPPLPRPGEKARPGRLIDVLTPIALEGPVSGDAALAAMPPTRRAGSKPFAIEGFNEATQQWETPQAGQRYSALPGRRAAGQPHRRAQRDRVLGVRGQGAGVCRRDQRRAGVPGDARRGGARPRTRPVRQRARRPARLHAARDECGLEPGLRAAERGAPGLRAPAPSRAAWCCRPPRRARRRCWACRSTPRRRWPTIRRSRRCAS